MIIFLMSLGLLFWDLGKNTLSNWDEAWLAAVARSGGMWNGERWWYEPPLVTWVLSMIMRLSQNEWWLRSFNAVSSVVIVMTVYLVSKNIFKGRWAGIFSGLVLLSTIEFLFRGRQINVDILLSLWIFLAVSFRSGIFLGLAAMTKRLSFLLAVPALIWSFSKDPRSWKRELGLFLLVVLPWHIYNYIKFGQEFIDKYLIGFTLGKLTAVNQVAGSSPLFYVTALRHGLKLWFAVLPIALIWCLIKMKKNVQVQTFMIMVATYLVGLILASIKASWYMLPIYPALALLIGGFLGKVFKTRQYLGIVLVVAIALFNLLKWKQEWLVPQTTFDQAMLAKEVRIMTNPNEAVYLDDDWLPVAVFYSQRKVIPLRFNRGDRFTTALNLPQGSLILTNIETLDSLQSRLEKKPTLLRQTSDLSLVRID